ncbi:MAG: gamma-glutamyl-phosphate reductase, partial [Bacteroidales bacterium]|nr:gamma-glutamyl-phosphate reductase [Bacteroidales bacterium]
MEEIFISAKRAARALQLTAADKRDALLIQLADRIEKESASLLEANGRDLAAMDRGNPLYDRLLLTAERLSGIAADMRKVASLPCPLDRTLLERTLPNGLKLRKTSVPFGVIGVIYEARPNVTFDVFSLCFKSGNACILKGGRDADTSNRAAVALIRQVLEENGFDPASASLLPASHEAAKALLEAVGYVDLVIPRGGRRLIDFVRDNSRVPCIETGA